MSSSSSSLSSNKRMLTMLVIANVVFLSLRIFFNSWFANIAHLEIQFETQQQQRKDNNNNNNNHNNNHHLRTQEQQQQQQEQEQSPNTVAAAETTTTSIVKNKNMNDFGGLDCGCSETCTNSALHHGNHLYSCGKRIQYLQARYQDSEKEACLAASTEGDNPPCTDDCNPNVCHNKQQQQQQQSQQSIVIEGLNCGCPKTCTYAKLQEGNLQFSCIRRIQYLQQQYHDSEEKACIASSQGRNPPCSNDCNPEVCPK